MEGLIALLQRQNSGKVTGNRIKAGVKTGTKPETEEKLHCFSCLKAKQKNRK